MAFTCWKWQDMSVASTISTTSALSSLQGKHDTQRMEISLYGVRSTREESQNTF